MGRGLGLVAAAESPRRHRCGPTGGSRGGGARLTGTTVRPCRRSEARRVRAGQPGDGPAPLTRPLGGPSREPRRRAERPIAAGGGPSGAGRRGAVGGGNGSVSGPSRDPGPDPPAPSAADEGPLRAPTPPPPTPPTATPPPLEPAPGSARRARAGAGGPARRAFQTSPVPRPGGDRAGGGLEGPTDDGGAERRRHVTSGRFATFLRSTDRERPRRRGGRAGGTKGRREGAERRRGGTAGGGRRRGRDRARATEPRAPTVDLAPSRRPSPPSPAEGCTRVGGGGPNGREEAWLQTAVGGPRGAGRASMGPPPLHPASLPVCTHWPRVPRASLPPRVGGALNVETRDRQPPWESTSLDCVRV